MANGLTPFPCRPRQRYYGSLPHTLPLALKRFHTTLSDKQKKTQKSVNQAFSVLVTLLMSLGPPKHVLVKQASQGWAWMGSRPETLSRFWRSRHFDQDCVKIVSRFWRSRLFCKRFGDASALALCRISNLVALHTWTYIISAQGPT